MNKRKRRSELPRLELPHHEVFLDEENNLAFFLKDSGNMAFGLRTKETEALYQFLMTNISKNNAKKSTPCSTSTP